MILDKVEKPFSSKHFFIDHNYLFKAFMPYLLLFIPTMYRLLSVLRSQ